MGQKRTKVLVTGASGFLGSHLCEELLKREYDVAGIVYGSGENISHLKKKNFKIVKGDIADYRKVFHVLKSFKPEVVFHTAAFISEKNEDANSLFKVNVQGTMNVLEACRILSIQNVIYSSSMSVYGRNQKIPAKESQNPMPASFYGLSKWMAEECARLYADIYKFNVVILRYAGIYGFGKKTGAVYNFLKNAIQNKPLEILSDTSWDLVYINDIVLANISSFEKIKKIKFETINIGSGQETNIKDLAGKIIKISGSKSTIKIKNNLLKVRFCADIKKAKKLLNFAATPLEVGLKQYYQELKNKK